MILPIANLARMVDRNDPGLISEIAPRLRHAIDQLSDGTSTAENASAFPPRAASFMNAPQHDKGAATLAHIAGAMIGTNDVQAALRFYDELMAVIGIGKLMEHGSGGRVYGSSFSQPILTVGPPFNGKAATAGNGTMVYFMCDTKQQVEQLHAKALASGGSDEGAPGPRGGPESSIFAAYFRDLDGNKICASCVG